jgi:hypothetical protein
MHGGQSQDRANAGVKIIQYKGIEEKYDFKPMDVDSSKSTAARAALKEAGAAPWVLKPAAWRKTSVTVTMPTQGFLDAEQRTKLTTSLKRRYQANVASGAVNITSAQPDTGLNIDIPGFWYRPLTQVIENVWSHHPTRRHFHVQPYHEYVLKSNPVEATEDTPLPAPWSGPDPPIPSSAPAPLQSTSASPAPSSANVGTTPAATTDAGTTPSASAPLSYTAEPDRFE